MKTFEQFLKDNGSESLLESRPYRRAVTGVATHQNIVMTGEKANIINQDPYADIMHKEVPKGSNA